MKNNVFFYSRYCLDIALINLSNYFRDINTIKITAENCNKG